LGSKTVKFIVPTQFPELKDFLLTKDRDEIQKFEFISDASKAIPASDLVITKSGTSTLESAMYKKPTIVIYKMPTLSFFLIKFLNLVKTEFAALPNILLRKEIFPELIQNEVTSENIKIKALEMLNHQERLENINQELKVLHSSLMKNSALKSAEAIEDIIA
jgi:lipid-A-disaccharide synthase